MDKETLLDFLKNSSVEFYFQFYQDQLKNKNNKGINYIGLNYNNENSLTDLKLYIAFYKRLQVSDVESILGLNNNKLESLLLLFSSNIKDPWQDTGLALSIKKNIASKKYRTGFHLRSSNLHQNKIWISPKEIELTEIDLKNKQGICFEYEDKKIFRKNYYYISDINTKNELANSFNNEDISKAHIVEYTESELGNKVILWYNTSTAKVISKVHSNFDKLLINEIGLEEGFHGFYENGKKKSKYYNAPKILGEIDTYSFIKSFLEN